MLVALACLRINSVLCRLREDEFNTMRARLNPDHLLAPFPAGVGCALLVIDRHVVQPDREHGVRVGIEVAEVQVPGLRKRQQRSCGTCRRTAVGERFHIDMRPIRGFTGAEVFCVLVPREIA